MFHLLLMDFLFGPLDGADVFQHGEIDSLHQLRKFVEEYLLPRNEDEGP